MANLRFPNLPMTESIPEATRRAVLELLQPLARLLLKAGLGVGDLSALAKVAYVRAACEQGRESGDELQRPNATRIAVVTGLTRVEVAALLKGGDRVAHTDRGRHRAERVLAGWWSDDSFQDSSGVPAVLPLKGRVRSFASLCRRYSGDLRPGAILEELLRAQAVRKLPDGRVEAAPEGEADAMPRFEQALRHGPPHARVDQLEIEHTVPVARDTGFAVK